MSVEIISDKDPTLRGTKDLPEDFAGPIRVVNIAGIDRNMCCGTHVTNLSDVQGIKLLHVENGKKGKGIVWFVAGRRVFDVLNGKTIFQIRFNVKKFKNQFVILSNLKDNFFGLFVI